MKHLTASIKVLLYRSTWPFEDALYGVVLALWISNASQRAVHSFDSKFRPWSENIWNGYLNLEKKPSIAAFAITSAACEGNGTHSTHLVNWSTIIRICSFPLGVLGRGPKKSICTLSIGAPAWYSCMGSRPLMLLFLFLLHTSQETTYSVISSPMPYQKNFLWSWLLSFLYLDVLKREDHG